VLSLGVTGTLEEATSDEAELVTGTGVTGIVLVMMVMSVVGTVLVKVVVTVVRPVLHVVTYVVVITKVVVLSVEDESSDELEVLP